MFQIPCSGLCPLSTDRKLSLIGQFSRIRDFSLARLMQRPIILPDMGSYGFGSNKSLSFFGKVCEFYSQTQGATDCNMHRSVIGWGGGGGGGYHTDQNNGSLRVYFIVQIPPFIDWTCSAREECGATAEITRSLQIDLVSSDAATTSEP